VGSNPTSSTKEQIKLGLQHGQHLMLTIFYFNGFYNTIVALFSNYNNNFDWVKN
jgi:hypothetical protein